MTRTERIVMTLNADDLLTLMSLPPAKHAVLDVEVVSDIHGFAYIRVAAVKDIRFMVPVPK